MEILNINQTIRIETVCLMESIKFWFWNMKVQSFYLDIRWTLSSTGLDGGTQQSSPHRLLIKVKTFMLRNSSQIQNYVISEESKSVVAWGWVGSVGDQGHEASLGSSLCVFILIRLMLFWVYMHMCQNLLNCTLQTCGFYLIFLNLICTSMKL